MSTATPARRAHQGLTLCSRAEASQRLDRIGLPSTFDGGQPVGEDVRGHYQLAPGAVIVEDPTVAEPFAFVGQVAGRRTHVIVAREYGDVAWPAHLGLVARQSQNAGTAFVRAAMRPMLDAIAESERRVAGICPVCGDSHDTWYLARYDDLDSAVCLRGVADNQKVGPL